jgi:hypothetical protein
MNKFSFVHLPHCILILVLLVQHISHLIIINPVIFGLLKTPFAKKELLTEQKFAYFF